MTANHVTAEAQDILTVECERLYDRYILYQVYPDLERRTAESDHAHVTIRWVQKTRGH